MVRLDEVVAVGNFVVFAHQFATHLIQVAIDFRDVCAIGVTLHEMLEIADGHFCGCLVQRVFRRLFVLAVGRQESSFLSSLAVGILLGKTFELVGCRVVVLLLQQRLAIVPHNVFAVFLPAVVEGQVLKHLDGLAETIVVVVVHRSLVFLFEIVAFQNLSYATATGQ